LTELRQHIKDQERERLKQRSLEENKEAVNASQKPIGVGQLAKQTKIPSVRKDSSPIKPLSSFLNLDRILERPHTADQISALWTAYHASRSQGTGRGFICATIPLDIYNKMSSCGSKYPVFAVPLPRRAVQDDSGEFKEAYEFHFLQWAFHDIPPIPTPTLSTFPMPPPPSTEASLKNPPVSTILFTPLQEYKLRTSFATPHLILTNYTDLVGTHGIVLLRGEITPTAASTDQVVSPSDFLLSQQDAQLLTMHLQRFYLWGGEDGDNKERERLLRLFHEKPEDFKWEDLLKHSACVA